MGKAELENIRKLCKVRRSNSNEWIASWILVVSYLFLELSWLIDFGRMYFSGKRCEEIVWGNDTSNFLPIVAIIFTCVFTFYKEFYWGNVSTYPKNNVTLYISQWITTLRLGCKITLMMGVFSAISYESACIVSKFSGKMELINVITPKYFIGLTVYMLTYFILIDAVIKFFGVIFRKSKVVAMVIIAVTVMVAYFRVRTNTSFLIVNFFTKEDSFVLFEIKAIITAIICFIVGYLLERNVKNSKSEIGKSKSKVIAIIVVVAVSYIAMIAVLVFNRFSENVIEMSKNGTVTKEYRLELPQEKVKYRYAGDSMDLKQNGIGTLNILEGDEPKVVIEELRSENTNSQIKDTFKDMEFEVLLQNGKISVHNKSMKDMYLYIPVAGLSKRQLQSFMGNEPVYADFDEDLRDYYFSTYVITIYLPGEYLDGDVTLDYYYE